MEEVWFEVWTIADWYVAERWSDGRAWQKRWEGKREIRERDEWKVMALRKNCQFGFWWISIRLEKWRRLGVLGLERSKCYVIKVKKWVGVNCLQWLGEVTKVGWVIYLFIYSLSLFFFRWSLESIVAVFASSKILTIFVNKYGKLHLLFKWYLLLRI